MKPLFAKPHLFISYSRKDLALADYLYTFLTSAGFTVYLDKEKTLIGENFVTEIIQHLRHSDAVVALISKYSAESPWCQAEIYHAHALGIMIAPIRIGTEPFVQAPPLDLLIKDLNYVAVTGEESYRQAASQIQQRLKSTRRRSRLRSLRNMVLLILIACFLVLAWTSLMRGLNTLARAQQRQALLARLKDTHTILTRDVINSYTQQFSEDEELISKLLLIENNAESSDNERLNAHLLSTALFAPRRWRNRWFIKEINWQKSSYEAGGFNDVTFMRGSLSDIEFKDVAFSGVIWNAAPSKNTAGLMMSNLQFKSCQFNAGQFVGTGGVNLDFINCSFRGATLEVSGFSAVHFLSQVSDPNNTAVTNEVAVFENSVIENCVPPPAAGVLEIIPQDSEVRFTGVFFNSCHFRGTVRPSWFKDCHFINCTFPPSMSRSELESNGNILQNPSTADEECD